MLAESADLELPLLLALLLVVALLLDSVFFLGVVLEITLGALLGTVVLFVFVAFLVYAALLAVRRGAFFFLKNISS